MDGKGEALRAAWIRKKDGGQLMQEGGAGAKEKKKKEHGHPEGGRRRKRKSLVGGELRVPPLRFVQSTGKGEFWGMKKKKPIRGTRCSRGKLRERARQG